MCVVGTVSASWMPSEHYCTFCDNSITPMSSLSETGFACTF